jgi:hypothetical protein
MAAPPLVMAALVSADLLTYTALVGWALVGGVSARLPSRRGTRC